MPGNPFYDAAVHTMSQSWHAFWFGALDPSGGVSVDKPPVDLWVQVLSVKLLGYNPTALKLPQALAGTLTVPLLYDVVRRPFGRVAGLAAAAALAVLPVAVLTARSDTMDTFMAFLLVAAAWLVVRAIETGRTRWLVAGGAVVGLAFNVKLFQALLPLPALGLLWLVGSRLALRRRLLVGLAALAAAVVVGFAWILPVALTPSSQRPYPIGSTNGSIWNLVFTFNGLDRLHGRPVTTPDTLPPGSKVSKQIVQSQQLRARKNGSTASATRLLTPRFAARIGSELAPALLVACLLVAFAVGRRILRRRVPQVNSGDDVEPGAWNVHQAEPRAIQPQPQPQLRLAVWVFFIAWLATGYVVFSMMGAFHPRYFETISPAVAAVFGAGVCVLALRWGRLGRLAAAFTVGAAAAYGGTHTTAATISQSTAHVELVLGLVAAALLAATALPRRVPTAVVTAAALVGLASVLIVPAFASRQIMHTRAFDAERSGAMPDKWPPLIDRYLRAHRNGTRYAFGSIAPAKAAPLIALRPQPVLMLTSYRSRPLLTVAQLAQKVRSGQVRYFLIGRRCTSALTRATAACPATARWIMKRGTDVTYRTGIGHYHLLYRVDPSQA